MVYAKYLLLTKCPVAIIALEQVFEKQNFQVQAVLYGCEISTGEIGC